MKQLFKNLLLIIPFAFQAQVVVPINTNSCERETPGVYYCDTENALNPYEGTWQYQNGNELLIVKLRKVYSIDNFNSEDLLIGEYKYVDVNGVEILNTLAAFDTNAPNQYTPHAITGNCVFEPTAFFGVQYFSDCLQSIKPVGLTHLFKDLSQDKCGGGDFNIAIKSVGITTELKLYIRTENTKIQINTDADGNEYVDLSYCNTKLIPNKYFTLVKQ